MVSLYLNTVSSLCFKECGDHTTFVFYLSKNAAQYFLKIAVLKVLRSILCCFDNEFENFLAALEIKTFFFDKSV